MPVFSGLARRAAAEAERHLREGLGLLAGIGRDLERTAALGRQLPSHLDRITALERAVHDQNTELRAIRAELDSLVGQLNDRLLPRLDERMDDTERDIAAVATGLVRTGRDTAGNSARLDAAERRITDLRARLAQLEQRTGLWRDLQATVARFGDDLDAVRARMALRAPEPRTPADPPIQHPVQAPPVQNITDRPA